MSADRIEKKVLLRAPLERVWRAVSDAQAFGTWFGVAFDGPFVEGEVVTGKIVPTKVDETVARHQEPYTGMACDVVVERIEPPRLLAFRWRPGGEPDPSPDAATTLVTFELEGVAEGTMLTITESGFDRIPLERRAKAFADNEGGWEIQCTLVAKYLDVA